MAATVIRFVRAVALAGVLASSAVAQGGMSSGANRGDMAESKNMALVGHHDLQGRLAYQPFLHHQGNRWIAYVGLHEGEAVNTLNGKPEGNGTFLIDVTDPKNPRALSHIPGDRLNPAKASQSQMVQVCNLAGGTFLLRDGGGRARIELWNVTDPAAPQFVTTVVDNLKGTHKNWWECDTGIAYLAAFDPQWRNRMTKIYNLNDPARPVFIRDFGLVGQEPGSTMEEIPAVIHGSISHGGKVYLAYGSSNHGVVQIADRMKLLEGSRAPTPENLLSPQIGRLNVPTYWGGHTTYPLLGVPIADFKPAEINVRDFIVMVSESTNEFCTRPRHAVFFLDITEPDKPFPVSNFTVPEASGGFCDRGGRFGPHATQESFAPVFYKKLIFVSYFNAGVRAVDVRDPFRPAEVGYYIPAITEKTKSFCIEKNGERLCKQAVQTNNVEVDERGYIYTADRAGTGMHILEVTGPARAIANF